MGDDLYLNNRPMNSQAKTASQPVVQKTIQKTVVQQSAVRPAEQAAIKSAVNPQGQQAMQKTTTYTSTSVTTKPMVRSQSTFQVSPPNSTKTVTSSSSSSSGVSFTGGGTKPAQQYSSSGFAQRPSSSSTSSSSFTQKPYLSSSSLISQQPKVTTQQLEPQVQERRLWNLNNVLAAFIIGAVLVTIEFLAMPLLELDSTSGIMLALVLLVIYAAILFFLLEPKVLREVKYTNIRTVETPVIREVTVDRPVYKTVMSEPVIKEVMVDRPVYRTIEKTVMSKPIIKTVMSKPIVRTVTKNVVKYRIKERPKLNIPRYDYTGSTETKVYHTRYCRLGKMVKKRYALHANTVDFFKKRKFRPCQVCILKTKKV